MSPRAASAASSIAIGFGKHGDVAHVHLLAGLELLSASARRTAREWRRRPPCDRCGLGAGEHRQSIHRDHAGDAVGCAVAKASDSVPPRLWPTRTGRLSFFVSMSARRSRCGDSSVASGAPRGRRSPAASVDRPGGPSRSRGAVSRQAQAPLDSPGIRTTAGPLSPSVSTCSAPVSNFCIVGVAAAETRARAGRTRARSPPEFAVHVITREEDLFDRLAEQFGRWRKARGRLGSYLPVSMAFTVCREPRACQPSSPWLQPRSVRSFAPRFHLRTRGRADRSACPRSCP